MHYGTVAAISNLVARFSWARDEHWFLETSEGNFVYKDPSYGGNNTLRSFNGGLAEFCSEFGYCVSDTVDKGVGMVTSRVAPDAKFTTPLKRVLRVKPSGCLSSQYALTVGKEYEVVGQMGSCVILHGDDGQTCSIHPSHFVARE